MIGSRGTSLSLEKVRKPFLTRFRVRCPYCCVGGRFPRLVRVSPLWDFTSSLLTLLLLFYVYFVALTCPHLKSCYKECVQAALDFTLSAEDFDELVDPWFLYDHFLGLEPSAYILQLILREERSKCLNFAFLSPRSSSTYLWSFFLLSLSCRDGHLVQPRQICSCKGEKEWTLVQTDFTPKEEKDYKWFWGCHINSYSTFFTFFSYYVTQGATFATYD